MTIMPRNDYNVASLYFKEGSRLYEECSKELAPVVTITGGVILDALRRGNKILICGNGGSAADAQHFAAELTGRFVKHRKALPAIALSVDTSAITAISNDYGFEYSFARQVEALANAGDIVIGITTSGNSRNIVKALETAKQHGSTTIGLTGSVGGQIEPHCHYTIKVPSQATSFVQEIHTAIIHIWGTLADTEYTLV